jgi:sugar O-acyltransferase (sialic acid O-acetyltransferase NeuD family)
MSTLLGIFGTGGFARETMQFAETEAFRSGAGSAVRPAYVSPDARPGEMLGARPVISEAAFFDHPGERLFSVAIGEGDVRRRVTEAARARGCAQVRLAHPSAQISRDAEIGEGAVFSAFTIVTADCRIGRGFQANIYSYVAHDCVVGDYVTLAPRASINGGVVIEDDVYVGTGAVIRQGSPDKPITLGRGSVIGMGAVVTRDVAPGATVIGNPARPLQR